MDETSDTYKLVVYLPEFEKQLEFEVDEIPPANSPMVTRWGMILVLVPGFYKKGNTVYCQAEYVSVILSGENKCYLQ